MYCTQLFWATVRLRVRKFLFKALVVDFSSNYMPAIALVCPVCEKPDRVWKGTTTGYDKVVNALSSVSSCIVVVFLFVYIIALIMNTTFSINLFLFLSKKGKEYCRVLLFYITARSKNDFLWYVVENRLLAMFEFFLFYWYLYFVAINIRLLFIGSSFIMQENSAAWHFWMCKT